MKTYTPKFVLLITDKLCGRCLHDETFDEDGEPVNTCAIFESALDRQLELGQPDDDGPPEWSYSGGLIRCEKFAPSLAGIFLAVSVVLEVLLNTRTDYQRALEQCTQEQCRQDTKTKIEIVQREIDQVNGVAVSWSDITTAITPNMGGGQ